MTRTTRLRSIIVLMLASLLASSGRASNNWVGRFEPCEQRSELLKHGHMNVGVWLNTANPELATQFRYAMRFWAQILDMAWHEENTSHCAIQVVDGPPSLFNDQTVAARSQFTDSGNFQGWIAFNRNCRLSPLEMYLTAIHEIGHMLGLDHNPNPKSVMFFLNPQEPPVLDKNDRLTLAAHHKLRSKSSARAVTRRTTVIR